jgi:hypothetical protein
VTPATPHVGAGPAIDLLLASTEPAVSYLARRDVLNERVELDPEAILSGPLVGALLSGQRPDGGFGCHPYRKWEGAHWRLVALVELGVPSGEPRSLAAAGTVLDWLAGDGHRRGIKTINGSPVRSSNGSGPTVAGTAIRARLGVARRSTSRSRLPGGYTSTGSRPALRGRGMLPVALLSSSWSIGSSDPYEAAR